MNIVIFTHNLGNWLIGVLQKTKDSASLILQQVTSTISPCQTHITAYSN